MPPAERHDEHSEVASERGEVEGGDAFGRGGVDGNPGRAKAAVEQHLDEEAAEGVAYQDGRLVEGGNGFCIVVYDLRDTDACQLFWRIAAQLFDRTLFERPVGGDALIALCLEVGQDLSQQEGVNPCSVYEHDGFGHGASCGY